MGIQPPKLPKLVFFGINLPPHVIFTKCGLGKGVPGPHHHCSFENVGLHPPKSRKMVIFGIHLPQGKIQGVDGKS